MTMVSDICQKVCRRAVIEAGLAGVQRISKLSGYPPSLGEKHHRILFCILLFNKIYLPVVTIYVYCQKIGTASGQLFDPDIH